MNENEIEISCKFIIPNKLRMNENEIEISCKFIIPNKSKMNWNENELSTSFCTEFQKSSFFTRVLHISGGRSSL